MHGEWYHPKENRGWGVTLSNFGLSHAEDAGMNVVKEFWPDIAKKRKAKKQKSSAENKPGD